ncbi:glycosyltransferase family 4 protein [Turicibacter sanguinis]|uniref:glycosyltransferase family 4 protein n=1 Tax=Turicibacter sanguinis TaxID=154288 RepID=UPI0018998947|nr:glycosyltransferase family 4 protein [Turicibacter sanguinis]MDB8555542.1 glycosyltransferase family 4 protein [Turicibacter sanguinis]
MKKILILANSPGGLYRFRKELIQALIEEGNAVYLSVPDGEILEPLKKIGAKVVDIHIDRRGINALKDSKLLIQYFRLVKRVKPDLIITYTIKPNIYGGLISRFMKVPYIVNITGLGTAFQGDGILKKIIVILYKNSLKNVKYVFFENCGNKQTFISKNLISEKKAVVLNGAGVNLEEYTFQEYPKVGPIRFLFIGRVMKEKGIEELFWAAEKIKQEYQHVEFDIVGGLEEDYKRRLESLAKDKVINYYGYQKNIKSFITKCHCIVLPSYHEGMSNVLLEGAAMGRPLITSNIHGCKEAVLNNGYLCNVADKEDLYNCMKRFVELSQQEKEKMGLYSRKHMEDIFDKKIVVKKSINYIK